MQTSDTFCPFCAENIKAAAIRCKHCHADLRPKGKRWLIRLAVAAAVALAAYLVFSDSEDKAEADVMADIAICQDQASAVASPMARSIIAKACRQVEEQMRQHPGDTP